MWTSDGVALRNANLLSFISPSVPSWTSAASGQASPRLSHDCLDIYPGSTLIIVIIFCSGHRALHAQDDPGALRRWLVPRWPATHAQKPSPLRGVTVIRGCPVSRMCDSCQRLSTVLGVWPESSQCWWWGRWKGAPSEERRKCSVVWNISSTLWWHISVLVCCIVNHLWWLWPWWVALAETWLEGSCRESFMVNLCRT